MADATMLKGVEVEGIRKGLRNRRGDVVAVEVPLTVVLNESEVATLLCSPCDLEALALGYLLSEGILSRESEILGIQHNLRSSVVRIQVPERFILLDGYQGGRLVGSGCADALPLYRSVDGLGLSKVSSEYRVTSNHVIEIMRELQKAGTTFKKSGGTHSCAIRTAEAITFHAEDIGRHNALDKIVGRCFLEGVSTGDCVILTTGRISSEIVFKVGKLGVPILVSRSAPTSLALEVAEKVGITIVGFARGSKMNIYCHGWRLV
ncbi:MAG: formate dehydrogenase accessory sulfurtransferase FdhD [Actinobacteria bacterium]|nr:formate dehydrogenase accessory sulfurtransferase FdhD [Actinomycetota bacterium]MCG2820213.1 formate dehydrogenase accessory sulfurtransferase FdhD [Actinomycetes bacterium]MBU4178598.1 formate dehydrogenase accessory sulfurtransferase FdhD [Actinomycetota bacterium]MBU4219380.1 formate dehydrogenase accessory sulfurtransferase FdhD [Actinomycetota bacterium]MBU4360079.1 formate dehydrogenase accessory sulfurtransferase FdhD [Actinomycetota bacterium]